MSNEDKEQALTAIADFERGGGVWRQRQARRLRKLLKKQPDKFWPDYFDVINQPSAEASALIRSRVVDETTTFDQLHKILSKGADAE
jgi:hypothetical protein